MRTLRIRDSAARTLVILLVLAYGIVPALVDLLGIYVVSWSIPNLYFSGFLALIVYVNKVKSPKYKEHSFKYPANFKVFLAIGMLALVSFSLYPWHDDRVSIGASVSAIFRAAWLYVMIASITLSKPRKIIILIFSVVLMFVDESRTYFMIGYMVLITSFRNSIYLMAGAVFAVLLVAATRMNVAGSLTDMIFFGIVGETYNATKPLGQIVALPSGVVSNSGLFALHTWAQPLLVPFEVVAKKLGLQYSDQFSYFEQPVRQYLGEQLSPMGGWYIVGDWIYFGVLGVLGMYIYYRIVHMLANRIFTTNIMPIGTFLMFIGVKATPYVFAKFMLYIIVVFTVLKFLIKLKWR